MGNYYGYVKHKRNDPMCDSWDSQGNEKNAVSISNASCLDVLIRNENITSEECKTRNRLKLYCMYGELQAFKVGRLVRYITFIYKALAAIFSHPALKTCNSPYMQYYIKRFFVLHSTEVIFLFLIKKSRQKAIEIETAFFPPLWNPKGRTLDHFFYASHIRHNFPYKLILISMS